MDRREGDRRLRDAGSGRSPRVDRLEDRREMRRLIIAAAGLGLMFSIAAGAVNAGGPPAVGFYVDGTLYRTVGTPTDFTGTGAPSFTYDKIYALGNGLRNVAEAKPGDRDFNGGRWAVYPVTWHIVPVQYTSDAQLLAAANAGDVTIAPTPIRLFFCNVAPIPPGQR
jgi:hypothetical protein